jgi:hypothetical protein
MWLVTKKKQDMLDRVALLNRQCYKEKLVLISCYEKCRALTEKKFKPAKRLLCTNEAQYMGSFTLYIMKALLLLREDKKAFEYFLGIVDADTTIPESFLEVLAEDLMFLFFADFTSNERSILNILRHFEYLLKA